MLIKLNNKIVCIKKHVWRNTVGVNLRKRFAHRIARKRVNETFIMTNGDLTYILCRDYFEAICYQPFQFVRCFTETTHTGTVALTWLSGLCVPMTPRAMPAGAGKVKEKGPD